MLYLPSKQTNKHSVSHFLIQLFLIFLQLCGTKLLKEIIILSPTALLHSLLNSLQSHLYLYYSPESVLLNAVSDLCVTKLNGQL